MTVRIGIRFCEQLGMELRQCATHAARGEWDQAERVHQTVEQMLDTFMTESGLASYLENKDGSEIEIPTAALASEGERVEENPRSKKKTTRRTKTTKRPSGKTSGAD